MMKIKIKKVNKLKKINLMKINLRKTIKNILKCYVMGCKQNFEKMRYYKKRKR